VVREIVHLRNEYGIREIGFYDDTFMSDAARVREICGMIADERIDVTWSCMSRINFADAETLRMMGAAGCHMVCFGVESADRDILKSIRKGIRLEAVKGVLKDAHEAGIRTRISMMLGNPGETWDTMEKSLAFAIDVKPHLVQFNVTTPYPGTEMFDWADRQGYIVTKEWDKYDLYNVVMKLPTVTPEEITEFYHKAFRKFYLRPRYLLEQTRYLIRRPRMVAYHAASALGVMKDLVRAMLV
jgi:radical SAM superfamily enzyme YgiQ (UPF0313 family)